MSPWNNSWDEVIDLTPDLLCDGSPDGGQNWSIQTALVWDFVPPLGWALEVFEKVQKLKGADKVKGLHQIKREDLSAVTISYNEEDASRAEMFNLGQYFN